MAINPLQLPSSQAFTPDITPSLAHLVGTINQGQQQQFQRQTLADLGKGIADGTLSYDQAAGRLLAAGDRQGALSLAQLGMNQANQQYTRGRDDRNFAFQQQQAQRAQGNADRSFDFSQRQSMEKPKIEKVKDINGVESLVQVFPNGQTRTLDAGGATSSEPANPFAPPGKMTESQSKDRLFAGRLFGAEKNLRKFEMQGTSRTQQGLSTLGGKVGWNLNSEKFQQFDQAKRDFLNAVLRKESGAVISPQEFESGDKQYFPQPGDSQKVIEQKRANRAESIKGIAAGAGQSYRPPL